MIGFGLSVAKVYGGLPSPWAFPEVLNYWHAPFGVTSAADRVSSWAPIKGANALAQATGANQPILLPYSGTRYLWCSGVAGNFATTPDSVPLSITGDLDVHAFIRPSDWTSGTYQALVAKDHVNPGDRSWNFVLDTGSTGKLTFSYSADGTNLRTATSSAAVGFADGTAHWVRVTYASATGKVNFYTSSDGVSWTVLGTEQSVTAGNIFDTTTAVSVGDYAVTILPFTGDFYRARIYNGIGGTLVFDADFTSVAEGATTFTESSANAATVTINSTGPKPAQIVGSQQLLCDGIAHFMTATFTLNQPETVIIVGKQIAWNGAGGAGVFDGATFNSMRMYQQGSTPGVSLYAGTATACNNNGWALGANAVVSAVFNGAASQTQVNLNAPVTGNPGASNGGGLALAAAPGGSNFANIQVKGIAVCAEALSANRLNQLIRAMAAVNGIGV